MNTPVLEDQLVSELWTQDVRFLMGRQLSSTPLLSAKKLLISLSQSAEARLRLSLIPLFLRHPEFASEANSMDKELSSSDAQLLFRFFFTAALLFQQIYKELLLRYFGNQPKIPDLFSSELGLILMLPPENSLLELARQQEILSGQKVNWLGTYHHAANVWLKQLELQHL